MFLGEMIRGLGGYCSGGASREASSCGGKGLCLFASVRSVIEYTALKVNLRTFALLSVRTVSKGQIVGKSSFAAVEGAEP